MPVADLLTPCEGTSCPTHDVGVDGLGLCSMCGGIELTDETGHALHHTRVDLLGMVERGDFG